MAVDETIFVPDIGFRPAEVVLARVPVTRAEAGRTVTVDRAVSGASGVEVVLSITGEPNEDKRQMPRCANDPVTLREASGRVVGQKPWPSSVGRSGGVGASLETVRRTLALEPLSPGTRNADLSVSGVTVPLEFEPATAMGVPAHALDAVVERHGIAVAARRIAFLSDSTAIELEVSVSDDERRVIHSVGTSLGPGACDVALRDDAGRVYGGQRTLGDARRGRDLHEVGVFPVLPADVRTISIEIADVTVTEQTEELTLPVGFDGEITLGGLTGHAKVQHESDEQREERLERLATRIALLGPGREPPPEEQGKRIEEQGERIEVECREGPWLRDRMLLRPNSLWLTDRRQGCSFSFSARGWVLSVADPSGEAPEVTISSALVQYRGPWRVEIALPPRG